MRNLGIALAVAFSVGLGCSKAPENAPVKIDTNDPQSVAKSELSDKLKNMTPEQRAQYIQQNPNEVQQVYAAPVSGGTGQ